MLGTGVQWWMVNWPDTGPCHCDWCILVTAPIVVCYTVNIIFIFNMGAIWIALSTLGPHRCQSDPFKRYFRKWHFFSLIFEWLLISLKVNAQDLKMATKPQGIRPLARPLTSSPTTLLPQLCSNHGSLLRILKRLGLFSLHLDSLSPDILMAHFLTSSRFLHKHRSQCGLIWGLNLCNVSS